MSFFSSLQIFGNSVWRLRGTTSCIWVFPKESGHVQEVNRCHSKWASYTYIFNLSASICLFPTTSFILKYYWTWLVTTTRMKNQTKHAFSSWRCWKYARISTFTRHNILCFRNYLDNFWREHSSCTWFYQVFNFFLYVQRWLRICTFLFANMHVFDKTEVNTESDWHLYSSGGPGTHLSNVGPNWYSSEPTKTKCGDQWTFSVKRSSTNCKMSVGYIYTLTYVISYAVNFLFA